MFYTRIPVPKSIGYSGVNLNKAGKYLPLIGILVGVFGAGIYCVFHLVFSTHIAVLCSMVATILMTGAFHEDGFADFCDGIGGGYNKEQILRIMKDSATGTYGTIGIVLMLLSKFLFLSEMTPIQISLALISAHALSRLSPIMMMYASHYVRNDESSKSKDTASEKKYSIMLIAIVWAIIPLFFLSYISILFVLLSASLIFVYFRYYIHKKIGGYTGDVLGALQQISELGFYAVFLFSQKWIV